MALCADAHAGGIVANANPAALTKYSVLWAGSRAIDTHLDGIVSVRVRPVLWADAKEEPGCFAGGQRDGELNLGGGD